MNNEVKYSVKKFLVTYYTFRYSQYYPLFVPIASLLISIVIIWFFCIPQLESWFSISSEIAETEKRITAIQHNISYMQLLNQQTVDDDFMLVTKAMPNEKDFAGILRVVSDSAVVSNVEVEDYSFTIDTPAAPTAVHSPVKVQKNVPLTVRVGFVLKGSVSSVERWLGEVERKLPLTEILSANFSKNQAHVSLIFYAKPFPSVAIDDTQTIESLSQKEKDLMIKMRQWSNGG